MKKSEMAGDGTGCWRLVEGSFIWTIADALIRFPGLGMESQYASETAPFLGLTIVHCRFDLSEEILCAV